MFRYKKTIARCFYVFRLSFASFYSVMVTGKHLKTSHTRLSKQLPSNRISLSRKSTDNNSQWFPLFPCQVAGLCAFSCRRRLSGMYAWPSCIGTTVRECYDVKEAEKCEEVVISSPSLWNSWSGLFLEHESVFFLFFGSLFSSSVCSVIPLSQFWSDILFMVVFRADMCSSRPALLASKSWLVCHDGSFRQWISVLTKQDDNLYFF